MGHATLAMTARYSLPVSFDRARRLPSPRLACLPSFLPAVYDAARCTRIYRTRLSSAIWRIYPPLGVVAEWLKAPAC